MVPALPVVLNLIWGDPEDIMFLQVELYPPQEVNWGPFNMKMVSELNNMFPQNDVQRPLRFVYSCLAGVSEVLPNKIRRRHVCPEYFILKVFNRIQ